MATIINPVRRTLVLTAGALAAAAGKTFAEKVQAQSGPAAAVAVVEVSADTGNGSDWAARLTEALTHISPPNLSGMLAAAGWLLVEPRLLHLLLLVDTAAGAEQQAEVLGQTAVDIIYRHLGVEARVTLIWLAHDIDAAAEICVRAAFSFAPQVIALSPLNEDGLRLPAVEALSDMAAELVWSLTLTSFYQFLAESLAATEDVYTGETPVTTVGIAVWRWSPAAVHEAFRRRWRAAALACWLAEAEADPTPEAVAAWQQQQRLDWESLATAVTDLRFVPLPDYERTARHLPWPWQMGAHIRRLKEMHRVDAENVELFKQRAGQQMTSLKEEADERLAAFLSALLDAQPAAGIDTAARWTWRLQAAWDARYEQMLDESATYDGIDHDLAEERGLVEAQIRELLESWPGSQWSAWLVYAWRVWRWPDFGWSYWQLRQLGLRLAGLLAQQAARRRQQTVQAAAARAMSELAHQARQWQGRVTEIGDMVRSWRDEEEAKNEEMKNEEELGNKKGDGAGSGWAAQAALYDRLAPDRRQEALAAAVAVGGLGRQLRWLDESVLEALDAAAAERFKEVWSVTAVDLLDLRHETPEQWQTWWRSISQMAAPLWCYDEAQLSEADRQQFWTGACVMGAGIERLPVLGRQVEKNNGATPRQESLARIPTADGSRLVVVRIRRGVTVSRLAAIEK